MLRPSPSQAIKNRKMMVRIVLLCAAMAGLSFASVPLYDLFCRVTGYDGTTQVAKSAPSATGHRLMTIRFNTDVNQGLGWSFQPSLRSVQVKPGEVANMSFTVKNNDDETVVGTSTYNVTPEIAGVYFNKIQCFCFTRHALKPGETAEFPVQFFVDPAIENDPNLSDVETITLSYTFFRAADQNLISQSNIANTVK